MYSTALSTGRPQPPPGRDAAADLHERLAEVVAELRRARSARIVSEMAAAEADVRQRRALRLWGEVQREIGPL